MGNSIAYTPEQVTAALLQLVANGGNVKRTSDELIEDDFMVPESTLRLWKNDLHAEQYQRLEGEYGSELERAHVSVLRSTIERVGGLEDKVLDKIENALEEGKGIDVRDLPATLRSLTDTKAKSVDRLLALTGRPVQPKDPAGNDLVALLEGMAAKGYLRIAVGAEMGALPSGEKPKP